LAPPSVSVFGKITPLVWERRDECPGAVPVIACHDEVVVECDADKAEEGKEEEALERREDAERWMRGRRNP
jgi:hypothetical protein